MNSTAIRHRFTDFFVDRNHRLVPSSPLIPNDPTLLLADAGMNQFKPYFLGEVEPDFRRATMSATVHLDDDEAYGLWREIGVPAERIQRLGMEENYRSMGVVGSTGPCSEIHYDRGPAFAPGGGPASESDRYLEICNLVFMQNIRDEEFTINGELPEKNIATGMGRGRDPSRLDEALRIVRADAAGLLEGGDKDPMG